MLTQGFPLVTLAWATRKVRGCLKKKKKSILSIYFIVIFIFVSQICSFLNVFEAFVTQWDRQCCSPAKQARNTDFFNYTIKYTKPLLSPNWPSKKRKRKKERNFKQSLETKKQESQICTELIVRLYHNHHFYPWAEKHLKKLIAITA